MSTRVLNLGFPQEYFLDSVAVMKKNLTIEEWVPLYPLFGFLVGKTFGAAFRRHQALFDYDAECAALFYQLGELNAANFYNPDNVRRLIHRQITVEEMEHIELTPVTALSLSEISRRPRETVRRKLKKMVDLGLVTERQEGKRGYVFSKKAIEYFFHDDRILYEELVKFVETVDAFQKNR